MLLVMLWDIIDYDRRTSDLSNIAVHMKQGTNSSFKV